MLGHPLWQFVLFGAGVIITGLGFTLPGETIGSWLIYLGAIFMLTPLWLIAWDRWGKKKPTKATSLRARSANLSNSLRQLNEQFKALQRTSDVEFTSAALHERDSIKARQLQHNYSRTRQERENHLKRRFAIEYRPEVLSLIEQIKTRLGSLGIIANFETHDFRMKMIDDTIHTGDIPGPDPVGRVADYLDFLARKLPPESDV